MSNSRPSERSGDSNQSLAEYIEVSANIRHYSGLRFVVLSAILILVGFVVNGVLLGSDGDYPDGHRELVGGATLTLILCLAGVMLDWRIEVYVSSFKRRAAILEVPLDFHCWRHFKPTPMIGGWVIQGVYFSLVLGATAWVIMRW